MSLTQDDLDEIKRTISNEMEIAVKNRFKPVLQKLDSIQNVVDLQNNDTGNDRHMFAEMVSSQAKVESLAKQILDIMSHQTNRIVDRVTETTQNAIDTATDKVAQEVEPAINTAMKKMRKGQPLLRRPSWWRKFWPLKSKKV